MGEYGDGGIISHVEWRKIAGMRDRPAYHPLLLFPYSKTNFHSIPSENMLFCGKGSRYRDTLQLDYNDFPL